MGILDKIKKTKEEVKEKEAGNKAVVEDTQKTSTKESTESPKKTEKKTIKKADDKGVSRTLHVNKVLKYPHVSEKSAQDETRGHYTFVVEPTADKTSIKDAVEAVYGVRPVKVRTSHTEGKTVRFGYRSGRRGDWKKAVVIMPKGERINIHEGV